MTTPPPSAPPSCPACGSPVKWKSSQYFLPNIRIDFECGYIWGYSHNDTWEEKQECNGSFDAAVQLRSTVAALTARVKELETDYAALEYLDHEASIGADEVGRQVKELTARAEKAESFCNDLQAERGVLLNGYAMIANYALPYFKKLHNKNPTHDTAELLSACYGALEKRTDETNKLSVEWMVEMRAERYELTARIDMLERGLSGAGHIWETENANLRQQLDTATAERDALRAQLAAGEAVGDEHYPTPNQIQWLRDCNAAGYDPVLEVQVLRDKVKLTNEELFAHRQDAYLDGKRAALAAAPTPARTETE